MRIHVSYSVGYQNVDIVAGPNLMALNWESVGKAGKAYLGDIMATEKLTSINENGDNLSGDYINTWSFEDGTWGASYQYCRRPDWNDPSAPEYDFSDCWLDGNLLPANPEMNPGDAFWLFAKNAVEGLSFAGQVGGSGGSITLVAGPNLLANAKPTALNLSDKTQVILGNQTSINENGDNLSGDYINTWSFDDGTWGASYQYCKRPDWNDPSAPEYDFTDCWLDGNLLPAPTAIPAGTGFWYFAKNPGVTVTFQ